ncbi:MAG: bifunctional 2-polyprenyl-6-hydroxyphenol methylase/3-demethylubiquinol 3-O-methyltransferase UbiG [Xanthomonadaceae bacterium]|jgi:2-polyprenyl-6-hydroxyphenyl methylase/3-demethylubiquinone-9 3-methyltransferase|nr:bifunctional 2-polyprenyl-6-hydroxyphenol methylase/3-demethylubiquinol 3-O-methyltransferase UbiG [Xanthomonadaceae bacterium]
MIPAPASTSSPTNADPAELARFSALAARWWDPQGPQGPLHALNPARLAYVARQHPLRGARVLDVGCGGGLLSEAMADAGAEVLGIDLAADLVDVARLHLLEREQSGERPRLAYRVQAAESLAAEMPDHFDLVTCMELLEHVPDPQSILDACAALLRPGGVLVVSTISRTPAAFALAIVGAEYLTGLIERGTHDWRRFIRPSELAAGLRRAGLELEALDGLHYDPLRRTAWVGAGTAVNYLCAARKPA